MYRLQQDKAPLMEALKEYRSNRIVSFDVPGHKQGRGNPDLTDFLGKQCMSVDVNSMKPLDNLTHPESVIKEAEALAADAFCAKQSFFIVNGTTAAVQGMILSVCKKGDKIIIPRNIHISAINALILCGAVPVYVNPSVNHRLGIPLGVSAEDLRQAIAAHPDAKAVFINNPTYYGICSDLSELCGIAHAHNMKVLVDEAHGTHFYFGEQMPIAAMSAGADMSALSMHKTGGSLTQSSLLLVGDDVNADYVRQILCLTQTTSASYLLMSSLDISRRNLAMNGKEIFAKVRMFAEYARSEINRIGGYYAFSKELCDGASVFDFDTTKLSIHTREIGLAGIEVYDILRDDYGIQVEFGDIGNILAIISVGDTEQMIERLIAALSETKRRYQKDPKDMFDHEYITPHVEMTPQEAFYSEKKMIPLTQSSGMLCGEYVMSYPPGIPVLAPGERITNEIIDYILYAKEKGCKLTGTEDISVNKIKVVVS
ncbi:MAG: aminotransferase class I/II-fold pyridoxal phosphate-dependent enzyme [Anaerofustis sp.]